MPPKASEYKGIEVGYSSYRRGGGDNLNRQTGSKDNEDARALDINDARQDDCLNAVTFIVTFETNPNRLPLALNNYYR